MQVDIPEEFLPFIQKTLGSGAFHSPEDLVTQALRVFKNHEEWLLENKDYIHAAIEKGMESIEKGNFVTLEEAKKRLL